MNAFRTLALSAALSLAALPALADKLPLNAISSYLNGLKTAKGEFTQINEDGSISTGTIYIKRPGRVRFEYNAPDTGLVIAGSQTVVIYDKKSNQPAETYPLKRTPLSLILDADINLGRAKMVTGHRYDGTATIVTAQDPEHPEYGNIEMKFTANPVELRQWIINNSNGGKTTVVLGALNKGGKLSNKLFDIGDARSSGDR